MATILVIYAGDYGNTEKMARAAVAGVNGVAGATAVLKRAEEVKAADLKAADGVLFGSPVHMGSVDWRVKKCIDTVCSGLWMQDAMNGKVAGVFVSSGGFGGGGGGCESAMLTMLNTLAELGMIIVPLPKKTPGYAKGGLHWGPYGRSADADMNNVGVNDEAVDVARRHGRHVANLAVLLAGRSPFDDC